jgi:hypothetical protein
MKEIKLNEIECEHIKLNKINLNFKNKIECIKLNKKERIKKKNINTLYMKTEKYLQLD